MIKDKWKIIAIVLIILFSILLTFNVWAIVSTNSELNKQNTCYYDICSGYEDAYYLDNVCTCYELDNFGYYITAKEEYMR